MSLNNTEEERLERIQKTHNCGYKNPHDGTVSPTSDFLIIIERTSIAPVIRIQCKGCKGEWDITDYDCW